MNKVKSKDIKKTTKFEDVIEKPKLIEWDRSYIQTR